MEDNNKKTRRRRMNFETALAFAAEEFERRRPRETWPEWLSRCTVWGGTHDAQRNWVISLTATLSEPLGPNEYWEEVEGQKHLVKLDPATSKKWYVIDRASREAITVFKVAVDSETADVTVLSEIDPSSLVGEELQGF
jgi:hypothetical protein